MLNQLDEFHQINLNSRKKHNYLYPQLLSAVNKPSYYTNIETNFNLVYKYYKRKLRGKAKGKEKQVKQEKLEMTQFNQYKPKHESSRNLQEGQFQKNHKSGVEQVTTRSLPNQINNKSPLKYESPLKQQNKNTEEIKELFPSILEEKQPIASMDQDWKQSKFYNNFNIFHSFKNILPDLICDTDNEPSPKRKHKRKKLKKIKRKPTKKRKVKSTTQSQKIKRVQPRRYPMKKIKPKKKIQSAAIFPKHSIQHTLHCSDEKYKSSQQSVQSTKNYKKFKKKPKYNPYNPKWATDILENHYHIGFKQGGKNQFSMKNIKKLRKRSRKNNGSRKNSPIKAGHFPPIFKHKYISQSQTFKQGKRSKRPKKNKSYKKQIKSQEIFSWEEDAFQKPEVINLDNTPKEKEDIKFPQIKQSSYYSRNPFDVINNTGMYQYFQHVIYPTQVQQPFYQTQLFSNLQNLAMYNHIQVQRAPSMNSMNIKYSKPSQF